MSRHLDHKNKKKKIKSQEKENLYENFESDFDEYEENFDKKRLRLKTPSPFASLIIAALLLGAIPFCPIKGWMLKAAYAVVFLFAALEIIWDVIDNFNLKKYFADDNFILLSAAIAFAINLNVESVLILIFYSVTKLIYRRAENECWGKIDNISRFESCYANVDTSEGTLRVENEYVNIGDVVIVYPGEIIPLDGIVLDGISTIDTASISGQTSPWAVNEGHRVFSGCRNLTSPIKVRVTKTAKQSTAHNLKELVKDATAYYSLQEKLTIRIKLYYGVVLLAAAIIITVTTSVLNDQWIKNLENAVVMLTAAGTAISLSYIGLGYIKSIGLSAEAGVFVKGADCIETMAKSETVVFDKTGIITEGRYIITDVFPNKVSERELIKVAATAERFSHHPIALALREAAGRIEVDQKALKIEEISGRGISAFVDEKQVYVGNTALLEEHGIKCAIPTRPGAAIHVAVDGKYWGHILVTDRIRRGAFDSLENLRAQGVKKLVLLTGDVLSVAKPLASKLNFDMLRAELKPTEKLSAIDYLMSNRGDSSALAFVGDGNSDENIMSRVDVGIALGALGSDTALSCADVLIMDRDIKKLPNTFALSRLTYKIALISMLAWFVVNILIIILSIFGLIPLTLAIVAEFILSCGMYVNHLRIK